LEDEQVNAMMFLIIFVVFKSSLSSVMLQFHSVL
jgi:hypothetical protein